MKDIQKLTEEEIAKLRNLDFSKAEGFVNAEERLSKEVGELGSIERDALNAQTGSMVRASEKGYAHHGHPPSLLLQQTDSARHKLHTSAERKARPERQFLSTKGILHQPPECVVQA